MSIRMLRRIACTVPVLLLFAVNAFGMNPNPRISISVGGSVVKGDRTFVVDGDIFSSSFVDGGKARVRGALDLTLKKGRSQRLPGFSLAGEGTRHQLGMAEEGPGQTRGANGGPTD